MVDLLQDVSLARHISGVATKAAGDETPTAKTAELSAEGISLVLSDLIERNWDKLESEAIKAGIKKSKK